MEQLLVQSDGKLVGQCSSAWLVLALLDGKAHHVRACNQHLYCTQMEEKLAVLKAELQYQEEVYHQAYRKHVDVQDNFDKDVKELYLVRTCGGKLSSLHDRLFDRIFKRRRWRESTQ